MAVLVALSVMLMTIYLKYRLFDTKQEEKNLTLNLAASTGDSALFSDWCKIIKDNSEYSRIHRVDDCPSSLDATFKLRFKNLEQLENLRKLLGEREAETRIVLLDNSSPIAVA